ncbi:hypothetical protein ACFL3F_04220, partial [Planctomycetota bacterium]
PARIYPYGRPECMVAVEPFSRGWRIRSHSPRHLVAAITVDDVWAQVAKQLDSSVDGVIF